MSFSGKKGRKEKRGRDYGGPFGGGGLTTQYGANSQPKPPMVIHDFVRGTLNTKIHDIFNPSKASKFPVYPKAPTAPRNSRPGRSCLPFTRCTK